MNGPGNTFVTVDFHGEARMDFEHFQDDEDDPGLTFGEFVSNPVGSDISPATSPIEVTSGRLVVNAQVGLFDDPVALFGPASSSSAATGTLTTELKAAAEPLLVPEESPGILWAPLAKQFLSPTEYKSWKSHIADMHYERADFLGRGDNWGAWWAVVRAHFYSVPLKIWGGLGLALLWLVQHWFGS